MQTRKQEYKQFLNDNFKGLKLRKPLFYNWHFALRFNLQEGRSNTDEYFKEATRRATTIFESAFDNSDKIFLVFMDFKYRRRKIRLSNFLFNQVDNLEKSEICFSKEMNLYEPSLKFDIRNIAIIKATADRINYKMILKAISHSDFPLREPRLDQKGAFTEKEIYFINIDKKIILNMYDDRGLDLISADKENLRQIYKDHEEWILDYDREQINSQFK